uniref:BED-type domain-containing protein n=1 Tax=Oryza brachyantha TaxID=4533 RepID=J3MS07_ORYBR
MAQAAFATSVHRRKMWDTAKALTLRPQQCNLGLQRCSAMLLLLMVNAERVKCLERKHGGHVVMAPRVDVNLTQDTSADPYIPPVKKAKKCSSQVWNHFDKYEKKTVKDDGMESIELWAKCKKCSYKSRREDNWGNRSSRVPPHFFTPA